MVLVLCENELSLSAPLLNEGLLVNLLFLELQFNFLSKLRIFFILRITQGVLGLFPIPKIEMNEKTRMNTSGKKKK